MFLIGIKINDLELPWKV